jgi:hypothetical protein
MQHAHGNNDAAVAVIYGDEFDQIAINMHFRRWLDGSQAQGLRHWDIGTFRPHRRADRIRTVTVQAKASRQPTIISKLPFDACATQSLFVLGLLVGEVLPCPVRSLSVTTFKGHSQERAEAKSKTYGANSPSLCPTISSVMVMSR